MTRPALVLVPGLLCDADLWRDQVEGLRDTAACVVPVLGGATIAAMAQDALDAAPPRFALAGLSMGGYVALAILRMAPERVTRLCLANTSARPNSERQSAGRHAAIAETQAGGFDAVVARLLPLLVHPSRHDDRALMDRVAAMLHRVGPDSFVRQQLAIIGRQDSRPMLAGITVPACVIAGDADRVIPPDHAVEIAARLAGARLNVLAACGHLSSMEQPSQVTGMLREWMLG